MKRDKDRTLGIWMNGELVGHWRQTARGQTLQYADSWVLSSEHRPLSLSLPVVTPNLQITGPHVASFFDNLLPDNADIRKRIQFRYGCPSTSPFDLLMEIGRDCVGALQILPLGAKPPEVHTIIAEPLSETDIATILRSVATSSLPGMTAENSFRISIAGAQEKTALLFHEGQWCKPIGATPTTHIFKLPLGGLNNMQVDMRQSIENEWLCLRLLKAWGMEVAQADIAHFEDQRVLIVERFDRRLSLDGTWWLRIPQEDVCQATGTPPDRKYENEGGPGMLDTMKLLLGARDSESDRRKFLKAQVLFWLFAAPDGHAKNFSVFLERRGYYHLTPLYDVMSVYPVLGHGVGKIPSQHVRLAMAVHGESRHYEWAKIHKRHWIEAAGNCGAKSLMDEVIFEVLNQMPSAIAQVASSLPTDFPEEVALPIFKGIQKTAQKLD
jgi:serine/threonine-protein kinase HipA